MDLIKHYHPDFNELIIPFLKSLVERIQIEIKVCHEKGEKNNIIINKCWNVIRLIVETRDLVTAFYSQIEASLIPLFEYMADPVSIEFEDDIVLVIKSFIKRTKTVSPVLWKLFPELPRVFTKNELVFGNLLDTLNYYLLFGKESLA